MLMLGLGLFTGINPIRIGLTLLVISRPRPVQNLLAYGAGGLVVSIPCLLVPLFILHVTPTFRSVMHDLATPGTTASSTARHIQLGLGVIVLSVAALTAVRALARRRQRAHLPTSGATQRALRRTRMPEPGRAAASARGWRAARGRICIRAAAQPHPQCVGKRILVGRVGGRLLLRGPGADEMLYVVAIIVASGAAIGTQVSAAVAYVVGVLAVVEITLACYLARPAQTQALVQRLHDWARAQRRKIVVAMCTVGGCCWWLRALAASELVTTHVRA
ncbi:hypothetical protein I552_3862 [Mycobacterium xenopi 3993]|nr:hypothetical protein I552_3862 [Mycobacterium xenopi 3993]